MSKTVAIRRLFATFFTAYWLGTGNAQISIPTPGCLQVEHRTGERAFIGCYTHPQTIVLGAPGPTDALLKPQAGDVYTLTNAQGVIGRAELKSVIHFPLVRR